MEASGALGNRDEEYFRLGANIYSELINKAGNMDVSQNPEWIRYAQLAIDDYERYLAAPASANTNKTKPTYAGMDVMNAATNVLQRL